MHRLRAHFRHRQSFSLIDCLMDRLALEPILFDGNGIGTCKRTLNITGQIR